MSNICNICGANLEFEGNRRKCPACGAYAVDDRTSEEGVLLSLAAQKLRLCHFCEAEELYLDITNRFTTNCEGYWGLVLCRYGIKYEEDFDGRKVPTCNVTSFECIFNNEHYSKAVTNADRELAEYYIQEANKIERIRQEWISKARNEQPYDVFICYKDSDKSSRTRDSYEMETLYNHLSLLGYRVFYARESLREKLSERFEPYIFNALLTAKVMIVYASQSEYFESTWLKNEWTRFRQMIQNKQKDGGSIVATYRDMDISSLPVCFQSMQCLDASAKHFYADIERHLKKTFGMSAKKFVEEKSSTKPTLNIYDSILGKISSAASVAATTASSALHSAMSGLMNARDKFVYGFKRKKQEKVKDSRKVEKSVKCKETKSFLPKLISGIVSAIVVASIVAVAWITISRYTGDDNAREIEWEVCEYE